MANTSSAQLYMPVLDRCTSRTILFIIAFWFKIGQIQVRLRFTRRDAEVIAGMTQFGDITDRGTLTCNFQL